MHPHEFPRRILLCVAGTSPQIITETLYALAVDSGGRPPFVPTEIRVITTTEGARQARLSLLAKDRDMFGRLCREYGLSGIHFDAECIEVLSDSKGQPLADILTPADNEAAADHITRRVADLTRDPQIALHCSIAGGRKTMGFYLGYALSLFGREQDRLSHVLVSEGFEGHPQFFYRPREPMTLQHRDRGEMSTADARIHLAEIPFIPLSSNGHLSLVKHGLGFAEAVRRTRATLEGGQLTILTQDRQVHLDGERLELSTAELVVLHWLASCRVRDRPVGGWVSRACLAHARDDDRNDGLWADLFRITSRAFGKHSDELELLLQQEAKDKLNAHWIGPIITDLNNRIETVSGPLARARHGIVSEGGKGQVRYRLGLSPDRILIKE